MCGVKLRVGSSCKDRCGHGCWGSEPDLASFMRQLSIVATLKSCWLLALTAPPISALSMVSREAVRVQLTSFSASSSSLYHSLLGSICEGLWHVTAIPLTPLFLTLDSHYSTASWLFFPQDSMFLPNDSFSSNVSSKWSIVLPAPIKIWPHCFYPSFFQCYFPQFWPH